MIDEADVASAESGSDCEINDLSVDSFNAATSTSIEVDIEDIERFASEPSFLRKLDQDENGNWESGSDDGDGNGDTELEGKFWISVTRAKID